MCYDHMYSRHFDIGASRVVHAELMELACGDLISCQCARNIHLQSPRGLVKM